MVQVTLEEATINLTEMMKKIKQGEEFVITDAGSPFARLLPIAPPRQPGSAVGIVTYIADDFDAPLEDFEEYQ